MKMFLTEYKINQEVYSSHVLAKNLIEAKRFAKQRGINERVIGSCELSDSIDNKRVIAFIHQLCFLGFIALKSGKAKPEDILGDRGILHEAIHLLDGSFDQSTLRQFNKKAKWLFKITNALSPVTIFLSVFNDG